jgi:hypothetical protein
VDFLAQTAQILLDLFGTRVILCAVSADGPGDGAMSPDNESDSTIGTWKSLLLTALSV